MNRKTILVIAVFLILLGGAFYIFQRFQTKKEEVNSTASFKELITKGIAQTCTYTSEEGSGTVYVSGGKIRGDFDVKNENQTVKSHMIITDNTSYLWTDGESAGIKMAFDPKTIETDLEKPSAAIEEKGLDPYANNNYKCATWITDSSKFSVPSNITFTTFDIPQEGSNSGCSYCGALEGEEKTQCLDALKCN